MMILNCRTPEDALQSVADILSIPKETIAWDLDFVDFEKQYEDSGAWREYDFGEFLFRYFISTYSVCTQVLRIDRVYWFHLSRTLTPDCFAEGIYPLDQALEKIHMGMMKRFGTLGVPVWEETHFTHDKERQGPFAMLVREIAFRASQVSNHDYLEIPEYIEDHFSEEVVREFKQQAVPVVAQFFAEPDRPVETYLKRVFEYLYCCYQKKDFWIGGCNTCYDGKGTAVPAEQMISIEVIERQRGQQ